MIHDSASTPEKEVMCERPRVDVKVERGSTFTYTHDFPFNMSILNTGVRLTCVRADKLLDSGNPP